MLIVFEFLMFCGVSFSSLGLVYLMKLFLT